MDANTELPAEREAAEQSNGQPPAAEDEGDGRKFDSLSDVVDGRDDDGNRVAEEVEVDELTPDGDDPGIIDVFIPTMEEREDYIEPYFEGDGLDNGGMARLFESVFPAFGTVNEADIDGMTQRKMDALFIAVLKRLDRPQWQIDMARGKVTDEVEEHLENVGRAQQHAPAGNR